MLDHDNSAFLCVHNLRGTVHSIAHFLRKIPLDDDKYDNRFSIDIGSCFRMDVGWSEFTCI